jgi:hypothetical protein
MIQMTPETLVKSSQHLFIGSIKDLTEWSVTHQKLVRKYPCLMKDAIFSMAKTPDGKYLYVSDYAGN